MSALLEDMVGQYLSCNGAAFVCPQFAIKHDLASGCGGSEPDFVVLDFRNKDLVVVEVSGASSIGGLLGKVDARERQWFESVKRRLIVDGAITDEWHPRFLGFVRRACVKLAEERFKGAGDVTFVALEDVAFGWEYWDRRQLGLPGRPQAAPPPALGVS